MTTHNKSDYTHFVHFNKIKTKAEEHMSPYQSRQMNLLVGGPTRKHAQRERQNPQQSVTPTNTPPPLPHPTPHLPPLSHLPIQPSRHPISRVLHVVHVIHVIAIA